MEIIKGYVIAPPEDMEKGFSKDFPLFETFAPTINHAWARFCHPSLRREGYENDGFKAVKATIKLTID